MPRRIMETYTRFEVTVSISIPETMALSHCGPLAMLIGSLEVLETMDITLGNSMTFAFTAMP